MQNSIIKFSGAVTALLFVASCSSSGGGGSSSAGNPVAGVTSSNAVLGDGSTAQFDGDAKTVTYAGTTYKFNTDPKSTSESIHISENKDLAILHPSNTLKHASIPFYVTGENLGETDAAVSDAGIALIGDLTPVADLPTSKVDYSGNWTGIVVEKDSSGNTTSDGGVLVVGSGFTATADFGSAQTVTGKLEGPTSTAFTIEDAKISGNTFSGKIVSTTPGVVQVSTNGGFFGPSADEIAGTSEAIQESTPSGGTATTTIGYAGSKAASPN